VELHILVCFLYRRFYEKLVARMKSGGTDLPDSAEPALSGVEGLHPGYGAESFLFLFLSGQEAVERGLKCRVALRAFEGALHPDFAIFPVGHADEKGRGARDPGFLAVFEGFELAA